MKTSTERILTTHTGSLPRPQSLIGDPPADAAVTEAVHTIVAHQSDVGLDVVSDGEASKPSYGTYVAKRLTGFGDVSGPTAMREADLYPELIQRIFADPSVAKIFQSIPACIGPLQYCGQGPVMQDIANLQAAIDTSVVEAFMTAASPGVIALFHENRYYGSHEDYVYALAEAMRDLRR